MESNRIILGALLFILIVLGSNAIMFFIARSWAKGGDSPWMTALKNSLSKPVTDSSANKSMEELRKRMEDLEKTKKDE
ncbi:MAG: hypothetical protein QM730_00925 [Anaerolineales bacterium]